MQFLLFWQHLLNLSEHIAQLHLHVNVIYNINMFKNSGVCPSFSTKLKSVYAFVLSVCSSICLCTLYFSQMSWNLNMLFISNMAWIVLKMVYMVLTVQLQRHIKVFRYITSYGEGEYLKHILMCFYCNKCNKIDICHSDTQKPYKKLYKY